jgi:hypothetical protein
MIKDTLDIFEYDTAREVIIQWGDSSFNSHALTIVGYNDTVGYDVNKDGYCTDTIDINNDSIINYLDNELGCFEVANSFGKGYGNDGFIWVPYRLLFDDEGMSMEQHAITCIADTVPRNELITKKIELECNYRDSIEILTGYGSNASVIKPPDNNIKIVSAFWKRGGDFPMQGINDRPIEIGLDYSYYFGKKDFGKVFLMVKEHDLGDTISGRINKWSLIDYRWNETFEIPCHTDSVNWVNNDTIFLYINYDLIPHENAVNEPLTLFSDMVSRFNPTIEDSLIIENISIDMYESTIHLTDNSYLEIQDSATIHAKKGDCKIIIEGDVDFGENIKFIADKDATLEIEINNTAIGFTIENCEFQNCKLTTKTKGATITNSIFDNSYIWCSSDGNDTAALIKYNYFANGEDDIAIKLTLFNTYYIEENEIDNYKQGIEIENSGKGITGRQNVFKNEIKNCTDEGLSVFKSTSYISENLISGCGKGLRLDNNSTTSVYGNPNTSDIEQMNRIYNADSYEIYVSKNSFPWYFHYNVISDNDNGGNSVGDPLLYFDTSEEDSIWIKNAEHNCWGDGFSPSADLYPDSLIDHLPMYCPPASPQDSSVVESQYKSSLDQFEAGEYAQSKAGFMFIVDQYPGTKYAQSAMRELLTLEEYADNDYAALKTYYQTNTTIQSDAILTALASKLANECDIILENYSAAVSYYEGVIQDPADTQDSIYAIIDLGFLYQTMDTTSKAFYTGKMPQYKPKSVKQFNKYKYELLSMLPVTKEAQTGTRDYRLDTYRDFTIRPNPVNNIAMLCFTLIEEGSVCFEIHNAEGVLMQSISKGYHPKGQHDIQYNASKLKPGLYYCSLVVNGEVMKTRKMVVVR